MPLFLSLADRITGGELPRLSSLLEGLRRYQNAPMVPPQPALAEVSRRGGVRLLEVGGPPDITPLVVVPSLINAPVVLDLAPGRSLVRQLVADGHRVLMVDWGPMGSSERRLGLAGLVSQRLMPLLQGLNSDVKLLGYCLGGTLSVAAADLLGPKLAQLALIATPWHYSGFGDDVRAHARETWRTLGPMAGSLGALPVSLLNPLFWSLDEKAVIEKFERLSRRPEGDPEIGWFAAVEDWANSGAPLSIPAARDLFVKGFGGDQIGRGQWVVAGKAINPASIQAPILDFSATHDRIVPASSRIQVKGAQYRDVASGHVGMVVGRGAREGLWQPLSNWLHAV